MMREVWAPRARLVVFLLAAVTAVSGAATAQPRADAAPAEGGLLLSTAGEQAMTAARADLLAFRLDAADAAFAGLATAEPASPAGAYGQATVAFWRALVYETPAVYAAHAAALDRLVAAADRLPASGEAGTWRLFMEGEAAFQRAIVAGRQERYLPAATAMRRACGRYADVVRADPAFEDAYFGSALCHIAAGQIPRKYRWAARIVGFTGTVEQGMAELDRAAERGVYTRETAVTARALLRAIYNDDSTDEIVAEALALRAGHPGSPLAAYMSGFLLLRARHAADAEAALQEAARLAALPGSAPLPPIDVLLGLAQYRLERYADAETTLERFLTEFEGKSFVSQAQLYLGYAREMQGDRAGAEAAYRRTRAQRDYDNDQANEREARRRLRRPMDARDRLLMSGQNLFDAGRYREAAAAVQPLFGDPEAEPVQRAEAAYRSGRSFHAVRSWAEAARYYRLAADNPGEAQAKWGPWSRFHLGEVLEEQGDVAGAREVYRAILADEHEFDYNQGLEQRARAALERL